ncbi:hypothetical protein N658DRAFT_469834 [Parathielavia hyrcaniae]|uniref:Uncharacterized protein n=1 Tax=Parathielavia hyrcaniae TaxID=113614 RepID=A0AAN6T320_9PEZI|nr:hypothetical protein N658DRAFT_469834 [Parathielavia hyrcaniae]
MNTATPPPPPPKEQEQEAHTAPPPPTTPQARLAYLYEDVTRLSQIAAPDIILHPADRDVHLQLPHHPHEQHPHPRPPLVGLAAAQQHEDELVARTGGTLRMDVESITVAADGGFGCVMGVLRVGGCCFLPFRNSGMEDGSGSGKASFGPRRRIEMPFCGVWRFDSMGRAVEHWENAADPETLVRWLRGE